MILHFYLLASTPDLKIKNQGNFISFKHELFVKFEQYQNEGEKKIRLVISNELTDSIIKSFDREEH